MINIRTPARVVSLRPSEHVRRGSAHLGLQCDLWPFVEQARKERLALRQSARAIMTISPSIGLCRLDGAFELRERAKNLAPKSAIVDTRLSVPHRNLYGC